MGRYVIEHGDVWFEQDAARRPGLFTGKTHVCDGTEELAIALCDDVMLKCGSARSVEAWIAAKGQGFDITLVRFPVSPETVAELNACLENSTRAAHIIEILESIGRTNPSISPSRGFPR
jgi:hypothetical protein|nr:hypothetical protein [Neorhizobium tomejilense]